MYSSTKLRGILRPKSARRTLVIGLIYRPRASKQFDIAFWVFWTWPGPVGHSDILIFKPWWLYQHSLWWCKCPATGTPSFIGLAPRHFLLCKSPGAGHTFWCKSPGVPGGMVTGQIDTCIIPDVPKKYQHLINNKTKFFYWIFRISFILNKASPNSDIEIKIVEIHWKLSEIHYFKLNYHV